MIEVPTALVRDLERSTTVVLSGAGLSTDSGIPDYRGPGTLARVRKPIQFSEFVRSPYGRRRYWARSAAGWPTIEQAAPNAAHRALSELEHAGLVSGIITQNVDRLHSKAGSANVVELHGALADVRCLGCRSVSNRSRLQERILAANPRWDGRRAPLAPDGDSEVEDALVAEFSVHRRDDSGDLGGQ